MIYNIGRNKKNEIIFNELKVSNFHAQLIIDDNNKIFINDLQSENGTSVNDIIINNSTELGPNDVVKISGIPFNWKQYVSFDEKPDNESEIKPKKDKSILNIFKSKKK